MAVPKARVIDGKKFMWDGREYESPADAEQAKADYEKNRFETRIVEEEGNTHVYTRRLVTEVVVEGTPPM